MSDDDREEILLWISEWEKLKDQLNNIDEFPNTLDYIENNYDDVDEYIERKIDECNEKISELEDRLN